MKNAIAIIACTVGLIVAYTWRRYLGEWAYFSEIAFFRLCAVGVFWLVTTGKVRIYMSFCFGMVLYGFIKEVWLDPFHITTVEYAGLAVGLAALCLQLLYKK